MLNAETGAAEMESYSAQISQIDNLMADPASGLSSALAAFFKGVQDVAANPTSVAARQSMLSAGQALTARFQGLDERLTDIREGANQQIAAQITQINTFSTQLADINQRIILARAAGTGQQPNDLLDQRDQMLRDLNKLVRVSTVTQGDGSINVFVGSGQPLVVGSQSYQLRAVSAPEEPERVSVGIVGAGGTVQVLSDAQITGGSLGGVLAFRSQSLDEAQNALGRIALTLAKDVNEQHRLGQDLAGTLGQAFQRGDAIRLRQHPQHRYRSASREHRCDQHHGTDHQRLPAQFRRRQLPVDAPGGQPGTDLRHLAANRGRHDDRGGNLGTQCQ